jgi:hypothetical protein
LNDWLTLLDTGTSRHDVLDGFGNSPEFIARVATINTLVTYDADVREPDSLTISEGTASDSMSIKLANLGNTYSTKLGQSIAFCFQLPSHFAAHS